MSQTYHSPPPPRSPPEWYVCVIFFKVLGHIFRYSEWELFFLRLAMTKTVFLKILSRIFLVTSCLLLSSQIWSQDLIDVLLPNMSFDDLKTEEENTLRLRHLNGSTSKDSLSAKTTSNSVIWNSWGIGQTTEKFL